MQVRRVTWQDFKALVFAHVRAPGQMIYRGQRDASWHLATTLHRTGLVRTPEELKTYADHVVPGLHDALEAWIGRSWKLSEPNQLAEFLAFAQHHGFPTPLLDWTFSPYIAAYFAFEGLNHLAPQCEHAAVYAFDQAAWCRAYRQVLDFAVFTPHVSILKPRQAGNHKLLVQQGIFTFGTVVDVEEHIQLNEKDGMQFLVKYEIPSTERAHIIRELTLMGITAIQLMPSTESVCKKAYEDLVTRIPAGTFPVRDVHPVPQEVPVPAIKTITRPAAVHAETALPRVAATAMPRRTPARKTKTASPKGNGAAS
jgi:hypothetical protein